MASSANAARVWYEPKHTAPHAVLTDIQIDRDLPIALVPANTAADRSQDSQFFPVNSQSEPSFMEGTTKIGKLRWSDLAQRT